MVNDTIKTNTVLVLITKSLQNPLSVPERLVFVQLIYRLNSFSSQRETNRVENVVEKDCYFHFIT